MFLNDEKVLRRPMSLFVWGPLQTLVGFGLLMGITSLFFGFLNGILGTRLNHNSITVLGVLLVAIAYFYLMALAKVKEAYVGLPTLFGERQKGMILPEGYSIIAPWPIMGYQEVPIQPTTTKLDSPMEILVSQEKKSSDQNTTKPPSTELDYQVRMKIDVSILWEVDPEHLWEYTSLEGGKKGVVDVLVDVMRRAIREQAQKMSDMEVLVGQKAFEDAINAALEGDLLKRLGIKIIKVQTTKIVPSDEGLARKYERIRGEDLDQIAEKKQAKHIIENIALPFKEKLGVDGDVALHSALAITKDSTHTVVTGNAGDFTKGSLGGKKGGG